MDQNRHNNGQQKKKEEWIAPMAYKCIEKHAGNNQKQRISSQELKITVGDPKLPNKKTERKNLSNKIYWS